MPRRYYRSIFDELEDMRRYMDSVFAGFGEPERLALAGPEEPGGQAPALRKELRVDVVEHDGTVAVTADMIPGLSKEDISIELVNPKTLEISAERKVEREEKKEGYYLRERRSGMVRRLIPLPKAVTKDGAKATFRNGVLEIQLQKAAGEPETRIAIE